MYFSSRTMTRPIDAKICSASARCSRRALFPGHIPVMPARTRQGVLGIVRTTGTPAARPRSMKDVVMPAAVEITICPRLTDPRMERRTSPMACGFTERMTMSAPLAASEFFGTARMP
jgi:hypothetical protein